MQGHSPPAEAQSGKQRASARGLRPTEDRRPIAAENPVKPFR
jgi:hypothetical protein